MRVSTYREGVNLAAQAIIATAREHGVELQIPTLLAEAAVRAYLPKHYEIDRRRIGVHVSPHSRALAAMEEGETVNFGTTARQTFRGRLVTARKLLGNPDARWHCETAPNGDLVVTRRADGSDYVRPIRSPIVHEMMELKVGESRISAVLKTVRGQNQMGSNHKVVARKYLGEPHADWRVRSTNKGIRLTRIA